MNAIEFQESERGSWHVLTAVGRIDTVTASTAEAALVEQLKAQSKIALDMSKLEYISSAGLRVLLRLAKQAKKSKKALVFFGAGGMIKEVLEASGMDMLLTIYPTADDLP